MNVRSILRSKGADVRTIAPSARLEEAARRLDEHGVGALVVVDSNGHVQGVISERDLTREVARAGASALATAVADAMTRDLVTARPDDAVDELMARMTDRRVRHLPVMDGGRLAGIVSIGDVVKLKIELAESEAQAMRAYITAG